MLKLVLLAAAFASFLLSVYLYFVADDKTAGIFVGNRDETQTQVRVSATDATGNARRSTAA